MAYIHFDSIYAPCGFLIVPEGGRPHGGGTILVQTDWDYPGVAPRIGWTPCKCGGTDGTVDCGACGRDTSTMIAEALEYIRERAFKSFPALDDYRKDEIS